MQKTLQCSKKGYATISNSKYLTEFNAVFLESCSVEKCNVLSAEFIFQGSEINGYGKQVHINNTLKNWNR